MSEIGYRECKKQLYVLRTAYPFTRLESIGKSVLGREILLLTVGSGAQTVLLCGGMQGNESISCELLLRYAGTLLAGIAGGKGLCGIPAELLTNGQKIAILPLSNPDGRDIVMGREAHNSLIRHLCAGEYRDYAANGRGVDLSKNFACRFEEEQKNARQKKILFRAKYGYGGERPESEPETAALMQAVKRFSCFRAIHFFPGDGTVYWRSRAQTPVEDESERLAKVFSACSGYAVEAPVGPASFSGFRNWMACTWGCGAVDAAFLPEPAIHLEKQLREAITVSILR